MAAAFGVQDAEAQGVEDKKWRDWWAAVLYLAQLVAVAGISLFYGLTAMLDGSNRNTSIYNVNYWAPQIGVVILFAAVFSFIWLALVKFFPVTMIKFALWAGVGVYLALAILVFTFKTRNRLVVAIVFLVFAVIQALYAHWVRFRVPFAAALITKVIMVSGRYPACYLVSYLAVFFSVGWMSLWSFGAGGAISTSAFGWLVVFLMLVSLFWTMEVIRNIVHVTVAGTIGTFYFHEHNMPRDPTVHAFRRATSTSLGSICFGSLIVAILEAIRMMVRGMRGHCNEFVVCCLSCLLRIIEGMMRYFNKWAFVQVALYGKPFIKASKDTWNMLKTQGFDCLINDDLTKTVLFIGCVIGGVLSAILGGSWTYFKEDSKRSLTISVLTLSFFIGYFVTTLTMAVVNSGVASYYVCFAEDPATLRGNDPDFYEVMWSRQLQLREI